MVRRARDHRFAVRGVGRSHAFAVAAAPEPQVPFGNGPQAVIITIERHLDSLETKGEALTVTSEVVSQAKKAKTG